MYREEGFKFKKKLNITSLKAAICNVALFKGMKEREFKDQIFISYSEEGVMLEANSQEEWERANKYVESFLKSKKMALLAFGFDKEVYEELIIRGLKDYTRRMKDQNEECPYINIIHYQKLRKSCEYMDKERYLQPLRDWQRKNKKNPNFAFLIVQPISKYDDVKRRLLQYLLKKEVNLQKVYVSCMYFLLLFFTSSIKEEIRQNYEKNYIELGLELNPEKVAKEGEESGEFRIRITNYTFLKLDQLDYKVVSSSKNLSRLGLEFISANQIEAQIKKVKLFLTASIYNRSNELLSSTAPFEQMHERLLSVYGQDYCVIPFKKSEREKYSAVINKFINAHNSKNVGEVAKQIDKNIICGYEEIQFLDEINPEGLAERGYKIFKACINDCPFMVHQYEALAMSEVETFLLYLEQLKTYYCTYLVRFYGISIKYSCTVGQMPADMSFQQKIEGYTYCLIFDYHHRTLHQMVENDLILDNFQIAQMVLQIIYLTNFLHTHEEPRSLGLMRINQVYWPLKIVLPYLNNGDDKVQKSEETKEKRAFSTQGEGFEGDVRLAGLVMKLLLQGDSGKDALEQDDHFSELLRQMLKESKYERIVLTKCMRTLQELLLLN